RVNFSLDMGHLWCSSSRRGFARLKAPRELAFGARSRFRSGPVRLSGETFGQAQSRSAADEGISPPVISTDVRRDCRILDAWVAGCEKTDVLRAWLRRLQEAHASAKEICAGSGRSWMRVRDCRRFRAQITARRYISVRVCWDSSPPGTTSKVLRQCIGGGDNSRFRVGVPTCRRRAWSDAFDPKRSSPDPHSPIGAQNSIKSLATST